MRNTLAFMAAAVIALGAVGFYLDWFAIRSAPSAKGQQSYRLDVNTDKITEDAHKAHQRLADKAEQVKRERETDSAHRPSRDH